MCKTESEPAEIYLVVAEQPKRPEERARPADAGGQQQGLREMLRLPSPDFKAQFDRTLREVSVLLDTTARAQFAAMEFESMEIGIAISSKGSIGLVTAGVDASLKLKFKAK